MTSLRARAHRLLLGRDDSWGATLATSRVAITALALLALSMHLLDLASGERMMLVHGIQLEQNPLARYLMTTTGPVGLAEVKLGVVMAGLFLFMRTARLGHPRLARNCLLLAAGIGLLGFASNLVG
jgi:small-conductance mechanosensitive channel